MATPGGQIGMSDVNVELGNAWNTNMDFNNWRVRLLADLGSTGTVDMWSLRNKSRQKTWTRYNGQNGSYWYSRNTWAYSERSGWLVGYAASVWWDGGRQVDFGAGESNRDGYTTATSGSDVYNRGGLYSQTNPVYSGGSAGTRTGFEKYYNLSRTFYI